MEPDDIKRKLIYLSQKLHKRTVKKNDYERKYIDVQKINTEQMIKIQNLQEDNTNLRKYKKTCLKQEEVIEKYEKLLQQINNEHRKERESYKNEITKVKKTWEFFEKVSRIFGFFKNFLYLYNNLAKS